MEACFFLIFFNSVTIVCILFYIKSYYSFPRVVRRCWFFSHCSVSHSLKVMAQAVATLLQATRHKEGRISRRNRVHTAWGLENISRSITLLLTSYRPELDYILHHPDINTWENQTLFQPAMLLAKNSTFYYNGRREEWVLRDNEHFC